MNFTACGCFFKQIKYQWIYHEIKWLGYYFFYQLTINNLYTQTK